MESQPPPGQVHVEQLAGGIVKLVKPDGPGVQRRLFDAFSHNGYEISPRDLRRLLVDCGVADEAVTQVLHSAVLEVRQALHGLE